MSSRYSNDIPCALRTWLVTALAVFVTHVCFASSYSVDSIPNPKTINGEYVANPDGILSEETVTWLNRTLRELETRTGAQLAVVAVESVEGGDVFAFAQGLFDRWRVGPERNDDGAIIVLARAQRTVRIHTGYGLEGILPDALCKRITAESMAPLFKEGRFDDGVMAGATAVVRIIAERGGEAGVPSATSGVATRDPEAWRAFKWIAGFAWILGCVMLAFHKMSCGDFQQPEVKLDDELPRMRWRAWLGLYLLVPLAIAQCIGWTNVKHPVWITLVSVYLFLLATMVTKAARVRRQAERLFASGEHTAVVTLLKQWQDQSSLAKTLFPIPMRAMGASFARLTAEYRGRPRPCAACGHDMHKLDERADDAHLTDVERMEEALGSVDYDVWVCSACSAVSRWAFPSADSMYWQCPKCSAHTCLLLQDEVLRTATERNTGWGRRRYKCQACKEKGVQEYVLPRLSSTSSSSSDSESASSSSSSSGSSSSWGGGSSGGGGASSSW